MEYRKKFYAARELQSEAHLQKDKELLAKHKPNHPLLFRTSTLSTGAQLSFDIIFELLEIVGIDQIIDNRQKKDTTIIPDIPTIIEEVKKKGWQKMKSFLILIGQTLRTLISKRQNLYTAIVSILSAAWSRLKEKLITILQN